MRTKNRYPTRDELVEEALLRQARELLRQCGYVPVSEADPNGPWVEAAIAARPKQKQRKHEARR